MIFIFLSCPEKAHDNKEFGRDILKPHCESQIMNCWTLQYNLGYITSRCTGTVFLSKYGLEHMLKTQIWQDEWKTPGLRCLLLALLKNSCSSAPIVLGLLVTACKNKGI